ncbi:MAG: HPr family phosphocarrier protein [Deltaproteobacteria bacterium]|nr:HPr family phosphocarrier protein [Deltaproteobacteria bacterium]
MNESNNACSTVRTCTVRAVFTLHARPAARLVLAVQDFDAELALIRGKARADAKSILDILALSIQEGDWLEIEAGGADADAALEVLSGMFTSDLGR